MPSLRHRAPKACQLASPPCEIIVRTYGKGHANPSIWPQLGAGSGRLGRARSGVQPNARSVESARRLRSTIADHWMQWGIYVLHRDAKPTYVGIASQLGRRIKEHLKDHHSEWDQFSRSVAGSEISKSLYVIRADCRRTIRRTPMAHCAAPARSGRVWFGHRSRRRTEPFSPDGTFFGEKG